MTPLQTERIQKKIKKIKQALSADKKRCGGYYDDSRGLRYTPPALYIQMGDFSGGLTYMKWFDKNFPTDRGFPYFLFSWTLILFKTGKLKEAEKKAFQTFTTNTYLFDKFFGRPIQPIEKYESSLLDKPEFAQNHFTVSHKEENLSDFSVWLDQFLQTEKFKEASSKYTEIYKQLLHEHDTKIRGELLAQAWGLEEDF